MTFTAKLLGATATAALFTTGAIAGGLDRSGQPTNVIFEEGRYLEFSAGRVFADLEGTAAGNRSTQNGVEDYTVLGFAYKADINDQLSYAVIYDEPYGSDAKYPGTPAPGGTNETAYGGISSDLDARALTALLRYEFSNGFSVYGGLKAQTVEASLSFPFFPGGGYTVDADRDVAFGYVAGVAYEKPELAMRFALTYHSAVEHENDTTETANAFGTPNVINSTTTTEFPEAINFDFQSGVAPDTLVFGRIRWANYSNFELAPAGFAGATGGNAISSYEEDSWSYQLGVGRRINDNFSAAFSVSYESSGPAGDANALSPANGRIGYTLGGTYTRDNMSITAGISYTDLGSVTVTEPETAQFNDNSAIAVGLKFGFRL